MDEKLPNFISGVVHALSFYGAIPQYLVPDNLKTAVTRHTKDELILNSAFADLEEFYDTIVLPPPPRKPKGKATVENHVKFLEIHLVEKLKESVFTDLSMLNDRIMELISGINQRNFKKEIRHSVYSERCIYQIRQTANEAPARCKLYFM